MGRQLQGINLCLQPLCCKNQKTGRESYSDTNCIWCVSVEHRARPHCRAAVHTQTFCHKAPYLDLNGGSSSAPGEQQEPPALPAAQGRATTGRQSNLVLLWISHHVGNSGRRKIFLKRKKGKENASRSRFTVVSLLPSEEVEHATCPSKQCSLDHQWETDN